MDSTTGLTLPVYATFPPAWGRTPEEFNQPMTRVAKWTEAAGLRGLLVFTDNDSMDPWAAAQFIVERTAHLIPLVAVQPAYMHPYTAARMVSTIASLYGRSIDLNLVSGSYGPHLKALGVSLDHDHRYEQLLAYGQIIAALLRGDDPVTHHGPYYNMNGAAIFPPLPAGLAPKVFVAGSSPASAAVANGLDATRLCYPKAPDEYHTQPDALRGAGIRLGIIARDTGSEAWRVAHERYPADPRAERLHRITAPSFEAHWHQDRWDHAQQQTLLDDVYWLYPFRAAREYCPYLVGSYADVGNVLARYLDMGISTLILSVPREEGDLRHAVEAIRRAEQVSRL